MMADDLVEVQVGGTAKVPSKYVEVISLLHATQPEVWQGIADEWVKALRLMAAQSGMEIDDFLVKLKEEAKAAGDAP